MTTFAAKLSKIDTKTKFGVMGWIRKAEMELRLSQIPQMLKSICVLYYDDGEDMFDVIGKKLEYDEEKELVIANCVSRSSSVQYKEISCYGKIKLSSQNEMIFRWDLGWYAANLFNPIKIGISSLNDEHCYQFELKSLIPQTNLSVTLDLIHNTLSYKQEHHGTGIALLDRLYGVGDKEEQDRKIQDIKQGDDIQYRLSVQFLLDGSYNHVKIVKFSSSSK